MKKLEDCIWYKENTVVHCKTKEEENEFCKLMDSYGLKWSYLWNNQYILYEGNTCYDALDRTFSPYKFYKKENYIILEWSEIKNMNKFTKNDLKTGMWVELRNGDKYMVVKDCETESCEYQDFCFINNGCFINGSNYNIDLKYNYNNDGDIIKILGSKFISVNTFTEPTNIIAEINQEESIMTIEEIEQRLGIKNLKIVGDK